MRYAIYEHGSKIRTLPEAWPTRQAAERYRDILEAQDSIVREVRPVPEDAGEGRRGSK